MTRNARRYLGLVAVLAVLAGPSVAFPATEVTTCGEVYSGDGFLSADLDCTGFPTVAITIDGGNLDLQGFTLTGGMSNAVRCTASCTVTSSLAGGMIVGAGGAAVGAFGASQPVNITVTNVTLDSNVIGVSTDFGPVTVEDATVSNTTFTAVSSGAGFLAKVVRTTITTAGGWGVTGDPAKLIDSTVTGAMIGAIGSRVVLQGSTIDGSTTDGVSTTIARVVDGFVVNNTEDGIVVGSLGKLYILRSAVSGNGEDGLSATGGNPPATIKASSITGNAKRGVHATGRVKVTLNSTITGNGLDGIFATGTTECDKVTVVDSAVTGNSIDGATCGVTQTCSDVSACRLPTIINTTCDTSYDSNSGFPGTNWDVCALD